MQLSLNQKSRLYEVTRRDECIANHFDLESEEASLRFWNLSDAQLSLVKQMRYYKNYRKPYEKIGKSLYDLFIDWGFKPTEKPTFN